jgi:hypothetical protein
MSLLCGVHALNNLLGGPVFTESDLNEICYSFSDELINPHKYIFGGDFDMNVLIKALESKGYKVEWHDSRKEFNYDAYEKLQPIGFLLNIGNSRNLFDKMIGTSARHWTCIRHHSPNFIYLDSKASSPLLIG